MNRSKADTALLNRFINVGLGTYWDLHIIAKVIDETFN